MPFDASSSQITKTFAAYVCTDEGATVARTVLERANQADGGIHGGGLSGAARVCTGDFMASTVLVEVGNIPIDMAAECVAEICTTGADVIVLGAHTDITTYRTLKNAGALEYFAFPVSAQDILDVQSTPVTNVIEMPTAPALCPSIAILGSNGGVGASLLAQNLAFHASAPKRANLRTALIDADLQFGSQAIDLDREETVGLFEALMSPDRIDETFLKATMDQISDHLALYSHQVRIGQDAQSYEGGLPHLYDPMRAQFDAVITDLPRNVFMQRGEIAKHLDALVLVIPAGFAGVNAATRLIERISAQAPNLRILPVLSEVRRDANLSPKDISTTIGRDIIATLPRADAPLVRAHRAARPLIQSQPRGPYAKAVAQIWKTAMADTKSAAKPRSSLLRKVFG